MTYLAQAVNDEYYKKKLNMHTVRHINIFCFIYNVQRI